MPETQSLASDAAVELGVQLGRLSLRNPIMVASGTFGYAREMEKIVQLECLGGIVPKTITINPRPGNTPWRTVETSAGLLNSIGLDNDGIEQRHVCPVRQRSRLLSRADNADLIVVQRGYQASSQVITVANEMLEQLFQIGSAR